MPCGFSSRQHKPISEHTTKSLTSALPFPSDGQNSIYPHTTSSTHSLPPPYNTHPTSNLLHIHTHMCVGKTHAPHKQPPLLVAAVRQKTYLPAPAYQSKTRLFRLCSSGVPSHTILSCCELLLTTTSGLSHQYICISSRLLLFQFQGGLPRISPHVTRVIRCCSLELGGRKGK